MDILEEVARAISETKETCRLVIPSSQVPRLYAKSPNQSLIDDMTALINENNQDDGI